MAKRTATALILLSIGLPAVFFGGWPYFLFVASLIALAAWEFAGLFQATGHHPARRLITASSIVILAARYFFPQYALPLFSATILAAMTHHLLEYEKGRNTAASDFSITSAGIVYIGWIGAYLGDLRALENGGWWLLLTLLAVWLSDTGAYLIGKNFGRRPFSPRLSPKKTWEGFWGGLICATLGGTLFAWAFTTFGGHIAIPAWHGAILGFVIGLLTPLGDLGESMLKREANLKDSSQLLPGHGGILDRIDSWLWAAILGYYYVTWFLI